MTTLRERSRTFLRATDGDDHPIRRMLVGAAISGVMFVLAVALDAAGVGEPTGPLVFVAGPLLTGVYLRHWLALPAAWLGIAVTGCVAELISYSWLGPAEWAARNAEHWQGDDPAWQKLIGQLLEYVVFGVFFAILAGLAALLAWWLADGVSKLWHYRGRPAGA